MIGEFCPKGFPLSSIPRLKLKTIVFALSAEQSAGIVIT